MSRLLGRAKRVDDLHAGLLEIGWAIGLKYTDGFTRFWPTAWTALALVGSMVLLGVAVRALPLGTAYAVWVGIGAVGTAALGIVLLGEPATVARLASIGLVVAGIVGLEFGEQGAGRWNLAFYVLLGTAIALAIKAIGILLMFAFLVIPASVGLALTRRLVPAIVVAMVAAAAAVYVGIGLSYRYDFPSAPMIIAVLGGILALGVGARGLARR